MISNDEKNWAMLCHASAFCGLLGIPYGNIIGPLVVWLLKKDSSPYVERHGRESLNFHLALAIYMTVAFILCFFFIGFLIFPIVWLFGVICTVQGAIKASNGSHYLYPLSIEFIK